MRYLTIVFVLVATGAVAQGTMSFQVRVVTDPEAPEGYICQDLVVSTTTDWMSAQLIIDLTEPVGGGGVYQHPFPTDEGPVDPSYYATYPGVEFDTYLTDGRLGAPSVIGGAADIGGGIDAQFDENGIDVAWYTTDSDNIGDELVLARITLSVEAQGTWAFLAAAAPPGGPEVRETDAGGHAPLIIDGCLVPEPATLTLLGIGIAMLRRRRRRGR